MLIARENVLLVEMLDYRAAGNDPYEHTAVIRYRHEIRLHRPYYQVLDRRTDGYRRILSRLVKESRKTYILKVLDRHSVRLAAFTLYYEPQEITLADRRDIMPVAVKHRNSRKACRMHLFERLPDSGIGIYEDYILLGAGKESDIHIILR